MHADAQPEPRSEPLTVLIASRDRRDALVRTLALVQRARERCPRPTRVVVVDNGSTDGTADALAAWAAAQPGHLALSHPPQGKSGALNHGLAAIPSGWVLFTDDDVDLPADWLAEVAAYLDAHPQLVAGMGRVELAAGVDPVAEERIRADRFRLIPIFAPPAGTREVDEMYGCNMIVRRDVFERVGPFNERLGPGASGLQEDTELSRRIRAAGLSIHYLPRVLVRHRVEHERMDDAYLREYMQRLGYGSAEMGERGSWLGYLPGFVEQGAAYVLWSMVGREERKRRSWARMIRHRSSIRRARELGRKASKGR